MQVANPGESRAVFSVPMRLPEVGNHRLALHRYRASELKGILSSHPDPFSFRPPYRDEDAEMAVEVQMAPESVWDNDDH